MRRRDSKVLTTQEELDHVPGGTHRAVRWHAYAGPASGRGHDRLRGHTRGCERPGPSTAPVQPRSGTPDGRGSHAVISSRLILDSRVVIGAHNALWAD